MTDEPAPMPDHQTPVKWPCPVCGHELATRRIPLRDWVLHPFRSLKRRDFDRGYPAFHVLLNHGSATTVHTLSPSAYAAWDAGALLPPDQP